MLKILNVFTEEHDPTTLIDTGTDYSVLSENFTMMILA